jgi:hypothetical protein
MVRSKRNKTEIKRYSFIIDLFAGLGRETLRRLGPRKNSKAPSLSFYREDDERTQKLINASFLPFFALLSIPPSFN